MHKFVNAYHFIAVASKNTYRNFVNRSKISQSWYVKVDTYYKFLPTVYADKDQLMKYYFRHRVNLYV